MKRAGFTLLEVLVAMSILVIIVLVMTTVFNQSTTSWDRGTRQAEMSMLGRSALELMARELSQAVADNDFYKDNSLKKGDNITFYTYGSLDDSTGNGRLGRLVHYYMGSESGTRALMRSVNGGTGGALVNNVGEFTVNVYPDGNYTTNLPQWVDITLTIGRDSEVAVASAWSHGPDGNNNDGKSDDVSSERPR